MQYTWLVNGIVASTDPTVSFPLSSTTGGVTVTLQAVLSNGCMATFTDTFDPNDINPTLSYEATPLECNDGQILYQFDFSDGNPLCFEISNVVWTINGMTFQGTPVNVWLPAPAVIDVSVAATYTNGSVFESGTNLPPVNTGNGLTEIPQTISQDGPDCDGNLDLSVMNACLLYTSPSPRDQRGSRMPSSA